MTKMVKITIPLSETKAFESKDVNSLRHHAQVVFDNLEQHIRNGEETTTHTS